MLNSNHKLVVGEAISGQEILVWFADDDAEMRQVTAQMLNRTPGLRLAREFGAAEELLQALKNEPAPQVVLLDLRMKGMSGVDAIGPIKQLAPQIHVIIFTSFYDGAAQRKALAAGAADFLLKRHGADKVISSIKSLFAMDLSPPEKGGISALPPSSR